MHPIERLRYVARAVGADQGLLTREAAGALAAFGDDPAGLVTACRRLVERHPSVGPLWWLCSRVLLADDPVLEAWQAADELDDDDTPQALASALAEDAVVCVIGWPEQVADALVRRGDVRALVVDAIGAGSGLSSMLARAAVESDDVSPDGLGAAAADADLVVLEATAVGPDAFVALAGSRAAAAVARHAGRPVWLVAGVGRLLPRRVWEALVSRLDDEGEPWERDDEVVPLDLVDCVVGPDGLRPVAEALQRTDCPIAPELLGRSPHR